jgi:hypothetical protein
MGQEALLIGSGSSIPVVGDFKRLLGSLLLIGWPRRRPRSFPNENAIS